MDTLKKKEITKSSNDKLNEGEKKMELTKATSVTHLHDNLKQVTKDLQKNDPQIPNPSKTPLSREEHFKDSKQAEIGMKPVEAINPVINTFQAQEKPKFNSFIEELAWKNAQKKQIVDAPIKQNEEPKVQINNHKKRLEELKQKQKELEQRQKELEVRKMDSSITREERWKITGELEGITKQLQAIEEKRSTINKSPEREKRFNNKTDQSLPAVKEPTATNLQQKGAMEAIRRWKEQQEEAKKAASDNNSKPVVPSLKPGVIPPPPPMPGNKPVALSPKPDVIPPMPDNHIVSSKVQTEVKNIISQMPKENEHMTELKKAIENRNKKSNHNSRGV